MKPIAFIGRKIQRTKRPRRRKLSANQATSERIRASTLEQNFLHDLANQVQDLSLACFGLHSLESESRNDSQTKSIHAIEGATQEMTKLIESFSRSLQDNASKTGKAKLKLSEDRPGAAKNVFPISPYLHAKHR